MGERKEFKFRVVKCEELSYKAKLDSSVELLSDKLSFNYGFKFHQGGDNYVVFQIAMIYRFEDENLLEQECAVTYEFLNMDNALVFSENGQVQDLAGIVPTLFSISYSTARGMLAMRTAGTPLENFPAPIVNPEETVKKAVCGNIQ